MRWPSRKLGGQIRASEAGGRLTGARRGCLMTVAVVAVHLAKTTLVGSGLPPRSFPPTYRLSCASHSWTWKGKSAVARSRAAAGLQTAMSWKSTKRRLGSPAQAGYLGKPNVDETLELVGSPLRELLDVSRAERTEHIWSLKHSRRGDGVNISQGRREWWGGGGLKGDRYSLG